MVCYNNGIVPEGSGKSWFLCDLRNDDDGDDDLASFGETMPCLSLCGP